ncbi:MAG: undecaprenyl-diphosphate phosphatase [Oscillospiraceae bacterium]|nr:undecaprenyl-diphosphate phosphatase [Oscillospiraceae bacterium]
MKIWEAIIYGILGGFTELLPLSFSGHAAVLHSAFNISALTSGGGLYVRAAITLGVVLAIVFAFLGDIRAYLAAAKSALAQKGKRRRRSAPQWRSFLMMLFALLPMLLSLLFSAGAERITRLLYLAIFFAINGTIIYFACRCRDRKKDERSLTLGDAILVGAARAFSVIPGVSDIGTSLAVGKARGFSPHFNLRFGFLLSLIFGGISFFYRLIRAFAFGRFSASILPAMLLAMLCALVVGYLAIQYLRYLLSKRAFRFFAYYSWDVAAIVLILSLINN